MLEGFITSVAIGQDFYELRMVVRKVSVNGLKEGSADFNKAEEEANKLMSQLGLGKVEFKYI